MTIELSNSKKTYLGAVNGRKRWALDCSIGAIQFREDGGEWQDIDPSIEAADSEDFSVKFTQVPYLGRIANNSRRRIYPDRTNLDCWIEFDKPFPNMPAPSRSDRWFYWNFPNAIMGIRFDNASVKFGFRLKNSNAPSSITIPFETQGIKRQGRFLYHDGKVIAELRKPVATDANEEERECEISFETGEVTINLDTTGLTFPINIDPDIDLQIGADMDDVYQGESSGSVFDDDTAIRCRSGTGTRYWGAHRWVSGSLPAQGDTIDVAYVELYVYSVTYDDPNGNWHFQKAASPARFTLNDYDVTSRTRTTASVSWIANSLGTGWKQTPSLKVPLQEVIDNYSPTAFALIFRPNQNITKYLRSTPYNDDPDLAAKLHIEWTAAGVEHEKSLSDTVAISDTLVKSVSLSKADTVAIADAHAKAVGLIKADTVTIKDSISKAVSIVKTDAIAIADTMTHIGLGKFLNLFDTVTITDSLVGVLRVKSYLKQAIDWMEVKGIDIAKMSIKKMGIDKMPLFRWITRRWTA